MVLNTLLVLGIAASTSQQSFAAEICSGKLNSAREVIRCLEEKSPEVQRAELELQRAKGLGGVASQWQNPELAADTVSGNSGTENISETNISLGVPIELGGKISARTAVASGTVAKAEAQLFQVRTDARISATIKLHRLRQLFHEQEVIKESITTFSKLVSQYSKRLKLSPEQELSVAVFRMAKSEYDLKYSTVLDELATIETFFQVSLGIGVEELRPNVLPSPKDWPKLSSPSGVAFVSPEMRAVDAELKTAQAEMTLARSESWPTLTLGPSMKILNEGGRSDELYGLNVSLPLPLFNLGGANRKAASAGLKVAENQRSLVISSQEKIYEELTRTYDQSVAVLNSTLSHEEIERKHSTVERLFLRGVVPSSLVIEAHRSFVELEKSRNERELKAIETLMNIYAIQGKFPEGDL